MIEASAASIPWMFATGNHDTELFSSAVAADKVTVDNYGVRSALAPLFSKYQVDLAVQGHNHVYERTNPLIYDAATNSARSSKQAVAISPSEPAEVEPARDGTTDATVGTAGTPRYAWTGADETDRNFAAGKGSGTTVLADARRRSGRMSASATSAPRSRPSTGRRPGTPTTASSRSTSPRPPAAVGRR